MKTRYRAQLWFGLPLLLLLGSSGLWLCAQQRQYTLNRQLIAALVRNDTKQALTLVNEGADPNTQLNAPPAPSFKLLVDQLLHRPPASVDDSDTAFLIACGAKWASLDNSIWTNNNHPENVSLVRAMLVHGADCKARNIENVSALHSAVLSNYPHVVQLLLEHGANINAQVNTDDTPLMWAVANNHADITRLLLDHGANVSIEGQWGRTALHYAVRVETKKVETNRSILRQLLAHGANPNHPDMGGVTPLQYAQARYQHDIVALLRQSGKKR